MIRICASITENNTEKCIKETSKAKKLGASIAEIRMDFLNRCEEISKIIYKSKMPLILTNRNERGRKVQRE